MFDTLKDNEPDKALEILTELDRQRIQERMTLRHKASKWLKFQGVRATRDKSVSSKSHRFHSKNPFI